MDADAYVDEAMAVVLVLTIVEVGEPWRLDLEGDFCIEGVSRDSRVFGSSSFVYLPIEGR